MSVRSAIVAILFAGTLPGLIYADAANVPVTMVVDVPYMPTAGMPQVYTDLLNRLESPFQVNQLLVSTEDPGINPGAYQIGTTVANSGVAVQFLSQLATQNPNILVYAYVDIEAGNPWGWQIPSALSGSIPSCQAATTPGMTQGRQDVLKSFCWANAVNQLVKTANHSQNNVLVGVAYEGQTFEDAGDTAWIAQQAKLYGLKFGWFSSGADANADVNFIELYDLNKGSVAPAPAAPYRVDTIAPETVVGGDFIPATPWPLDPNNQPCDPTQGATVPDPYVVCPYGSNIFPGTQMSGPGSCDTKHNKWVPTGAVGANIYDCAINSTGSATLCQFTSYPSVYEANNPEDKIMQSLNYIYKYTNPGPIPPVTASDLSGNNNVVYMFSAQYIGPLNSYYGGGQQCIENTGNCHCVASQYSPTASCGDENGFGAWGDGQEHNDTVLRANFQNFLNNFSNQVCAGSSSCSVGIYMYNYLPAQWFTGS